MVYTPLTKLAMRICFDAHKDAMDRGGVPYVFHPFHLAEQFTDEKLAAVALLHDVLEDSDYTIQDLFDAELPEDVVYAVIAMTRNPDDGTYMDYIRTLAANDLARAVKIEDLKHNSDLTRLEAVTENDRARVRNRYEEALRYLIEYPKKPFC